MPIIKFSILFNIGVFLSSGSLAFAGGIVGNGAGLAEQNVQFAYLSLNKVIAHCLATPKLCNLVVTELMVLEKIEWVLAKNSSNPNRIKFVSEKENPGFFTTSSIENNRIAKTGLNSRQPIFFNVDELYNPNGFPTLDFSGLSAILVHELGHQTGEANHAMLDILGAKIRKTLSQNLTSLRYDFPSSQVSIELGIINYSFPMAVADLYLSVDGTPAEVLTREIVKELHCKDSSTSFVGYEITNGHWDFVSSDQNPRKGIDFSAWVRLFCSKTAPSNAIIGIENLNLILHISETGKLTGVETLSINRNSSKRRH